ncbi:LuxR family transcriptional regulator [Spelaeicoccus albus]|uniref:DNA-binding CsgD family transcriptional regulator/tetratricopeptide (TPR) repeat protein n=1 Tax=Spelaeicoccus albus TaxID=1280376 RepID=A0A7Z0IHN4_9MICO|nr:LuxR family transcriptional regulator [Spelaeicoccus albus]NYI67863.1 DNA-binding CsgD family transcriptional regulator/tetratricopeptide (TPR) repeat protein [Spelaeicoccus albus]
MATTSVRPLLNGGPTAWPEVGRDLEIEHVSKLLNDPNCQGVMLLGELGVGKTWIGKRGLSSLDVEVIPLRATALVADIPMGALGPLLARLPERPTDAIAALQMLVQYFGNRSNIVPIVLEIDDAHHLDDSSAMVITQLVLGGQVKLLATGRPAPMPHVELMELVNEGYLTVVHVQPMESTTIARLVRGFFNGQVSRQLESAVVGAVGGNPFLLKMLLSELVDSDAVVESDGVWVLTRAETDSWLNRGAIAHAQARLARLPSVLRATLETVAVAEPISRVSLLELVDEQDVDELVGMDLLSVTRHPAVVSVHQTLFGEALRRAVPAGRRNEIRDRLNAKLDRSRLTYWRLMTMVKLDMACNAMVPAEDAVKAARFAIGANDGHFALRVIDSVESRDDVDEQTTFDLGLLRAAARIMVDGAEAGLADLEQLCSQPLDLHNLVNVYATRARICLSERGDIERTVAILREGESRLDDYADEAGKADARIRFGAGHLITATRAGRFAEAMPGLEKMYTDGDVSLVLKIDIAHSLCECYLATGRLHRAILVSEWLRGLLSEWPDLPMALQRNALETVCATSIAASDWQTATAVLHDVYRRAGRFIVLNGGATEMTQAVIHLGKGNVKHALKHLKGALAASKMFDPSGIKPHIFATMAQAYDLVGDESSAVKYLRAAESELARCNHGMYFKSTVELTILTCRTRMGTTDALTDLAAFADRMKAAGLLYLELDALVVLGMAGDSRALGELIARTGEAEGLKARVYRLYGEGRLAEDPQKLMRAAGLAQEGSQHLLAAQLASAGLQAMTAPKTRQEILLRNNLRVLFDRCRSKCEDVVDSLFALDADANAEQLTAREREIVQLLAKGMSNRDIADELTVSVRTVEGHLYRIYPKLGVNRRGDIPMAVNALPTE